MLEYVETMTRLSEMESRYKSGFSFTDRALLDQLNTVLFGSIISQTGCADCYRDAYILITNKLKKDKTMPKTTSNYKLKPGALIHPFGSPNYYTNRLPNDAAAEEYLAEFPESIVMFEEFPVNWKERVEARKNGEAVAEDAVAANVDELCKQLADAEEELAAAKAEIAALQQSTAEDDGLQAELEAAKAEIAQLKAENRSLKAANTKLKNKDAEQTKE